MQYAWYEIVGMSVLVGLIVFVVFRGLDLALEWLLKRLQARRDRLANALENMVETAGPASASLVQVLWKIRKIRRG